MPPFSIRKLIHWIVTKKLFDNFIMLVILVSFFHFEIFFSFPSWPLGHTGEPFPPWSSLSIQNFCEFFYLYRFISSVRSSSVYHGLSITYPLPSAGHFSNFQFLQILKCLKDPTCAIFFEKHGIQGYRIWHSRVSNVKYTNTRLHKYANTKIQSV